MRARAVPRPSRSPRSRPPTRSPSSSGRPATPQPCRGRRADTAAPPVHGAQRALATSTTTPTRPTPTRPGPARRATTRSLDASPRASAASITFDSAGRIVTVCVGLDGPDAEDARPGDARRAGRRMAAAAAPAAALGNLFNDFAGGGYFYLDNHDRAVIPTTRATSSSSARPPAPASRLEHDYDVSGAVAAGDKIISALPDWSGASGSRPRRASSGTVDPASGRGASALRHGEPIGNSFAVDETGGVYIVTDARAVPLRRRRRRRAEGRPGASPTRTSAIAKPGQTEAGSGTTPTLMGARLRRRSPTTPTR